MKTRFIQEQFAYDGSQLRSLFAYLDHGILGDSIIGWQGPCDIPFAHMVDGEDLRERAAIRGGSMLHFIVELFNPELSTTVWVQRLLASLAADLLREGISGPAIAATVRREGDDIYVCDRKFSISIATKSPVSALIHFGVNVSNDGTPVPTAALQEFNLPAQGFAETLLERFRREYISVHEATAKVRWVR